MNKNQYVNSTLKCVQSAIAAIIVFGIYACQDEIVPNKSAKEPLFELLIKESIQKNDVASVDSMLGNWSPRDLDTLPIGISNAMQLAVEYRSIPVIEYLLSKGASYHGIPTKRAPDCSCSENIDVCKKLNEKSLVGRDSIKEVIFNSPACMAIRFWKIKNEYETGVNAYIVEQFVKYGLGKRLEISADECNPLIQAIDVDYIDLVKHLIRKEHNYSTTYGITRPYAKIARSLKMLELIERSSLDSVYKQNNDSLYKHEMKEIRSFIKKVYEPKYY